MDPDSPATRSELVRWVAAGTRVLPESHLPLQEETNKGDGPISRGELAELIVKLLGADLKDAS